MQTTRFFFSPLKYKKGKQKNQNQNKKKAEKDSVIPIVLPAV